MKRKILNYHGTEYYRLRDLINEHPECEHIDERKDLSGLVFVFFGESYVNEDAWNEFVIQIKLSEDYYNPTNVADMYGYSGNQPECFLFPVLEDLTETYRHNNVTYYLKKDVDKLPDISAIYSKAYSREMVPAIELVRYHNNNRLYSTGNIVISSDNVNYLFSTKEIFETPYQICVLGSYEQVCREFERRCESLNEIDWFRNYLGEPARSKIETYKMLQEYYRTVINKSASVFREKVAKGYIGRSKDIYESLSGEIFELEEDVVKNLISDKVFREKYDIGFLNYVKSIYSDFCPSINTFRVKANNDPNNNEDDLLEPEEFAALYDAAIDVNRHLRNAYEDKFYSRYWLYVLVLLVNFERGKDVVGMPVLDLPMEYDLDYLEKTGLSNAEIVYINRIFGVEARGILSSKRLKKKNHYTTTQILPAMAYATYICNLHAINNNARNLFDANKGFIGDRIFSKLGPEFKNLSSRKLNYTLAYYFEEAGEASSEYRTNVYEYLSIMRGHTLENPLSVSQATAAYIKSKSENDNLEEVARAVIEKGAFGWMYTAILNVIESLPVDAKKEVMVINSVQELYGPRDIELLSKFYLNLQKEREDCVSMLKSYDKNALFSFIYNIGSVGTFRDESVLPCPFSGFCPHPRRQCKYCEYSVKTLLAMDVYEDEFLNVIEDLKNTDNEEQIERDKYLLQKILTVFTDFVKEYGKDVLYAMIDIEEIKESLREIERRGE